MTYEEFLEFVPAKCLYETIYDDSNGRPILVIGMLQAYGMVNRFAAFVADAEREACAKVCEQDDSMRWSGAADAIRARKVTK